MKDSNSKEKHFENITMNEILVAFSQKYHGHFFKILEALKEKERLTNKDIKQYLEDVEEMNETILSDKYPSPLKEIPNPPFVLYYEGNLELMDKKGIQISLPVDEENYHRCFFALEENNGQMDYCIGVEDESDLSFVVENFIERNPHYKFVDQKVKKWEIRWYNNMNDFNDINTIIEDYPFDEDNPFLMEIPSNETVYRKDELINNENE